MVVNKRDKSTLLHILYDIIDTTSTIDTFVAHLNNALASLREAPHSTLLVSVGIKELFNWIDQS